MKQVNLTAVIIIALLCLGFGVVVGRKTVSPCADTIGTTSNTIVTRDTIRPEVPKPAKSEVVETVRVKPRKTTDVPINPAVDKDEAQGVQIDSAGVVSIPITQKEYVTEDYKAIVKGYNPELLSMELYPKTVTVTNTVTKYKPPRWALTVGAGGGYTGKEFVPYVGATLGFVIWSK